MSRTGNGLPNSTDKKWGYRWTILFVVWLLYIINYFDRISVLVFLPYIQKDLNLTASEVGWLGSIFFFGYAVAQLSSGYLSDKIGPKKTMGIAIWIFTAVTFVTVPAMGTPGDTLVRVYDHDDMTVRFFAFLVTIYENVADTEARGIVAALELLRHEGVVVRHHRRG